MGILWVLKNNLKIVVLTWLCSSRVVLRIGLEFELGQSPSISLVLGVSLF